MSRFFKDFTEAHGEIKRDLGEMGIMVHPETMQDKDVKDDVGFWTKELHNYSYTVLNPNLDMIPGLHREWVVAEFKERLAGALNPGNAWKIRKEIWFDLMEHKSPLSRANPEAHPRYAHMKKFAYTYSQRMGGKHIKLLIDELEAHPHSRQLWLPVWYPIDETRRGKRRVPCSLGYWFSLRDQGVGEQLHVTYVMRSCDFITHWPNDVALAVMLMKFIAKMANVKPGTFSQFVGSLHVYAKDVEDVF